MQAGGHQGQPIARLHQHAHHLGTERRERGQRPQKAGDQGKAPQGVQLRQGLKEHQDAVANADKRETDLLATLKPDGTADRDALAAEPGMP